MKSYVVYMLLGLGIVTIAQAKQEKKAPTPSTPPPAAAPPAAAPPAAAATSQPWIQVEISPLEKEIVRQHLADIRQVAGKKPPSEKARPPGGAKKVTSGETLPPGWQKKIAPGAVLPSAVYSQAQPLPEVVIRKLPPPPAGTMLVILDGKLLRLLEATRTIVDVFELK